MLEIHRLDEMMVEAHLARTAAVFFLAAAGDGDDEGGGAARTFRIRGDGSAVELAAGADDGETEPEASPSRNKTPPMAGRACLRMGDKGDFRLNPFTV